MSKGSFNNKIVKKYLEIISKIESIRKNNNVLDEY